MSDVASMSTPLTTQPSNLQVDSAFGDSQETGEFTTSSVSSRLSPMATGSSDVRSIVDCSSPASSLLYDDSCLSPISATTNNVVSMCGGCSFGQAGVVLDRAIRELWSASILAPVVGPLQLVSAILLRGSIGIAIGGLLLLVWQAIFGGVDVEVLDGSVSASVRASLFVESAVKLAVFFLLHYALFNTKSLRPSQFPTTEQTDAIGRRAALVLIIYEITSFTLLTARFQSIPFICGRHASQHSFFITMSVRFAWIVVVMHTLIVAAIGGMAAAVLARKENQEMLSAVRDDLNQRLANAPSISEIVGRVCHTVCGAPTIAASKSSTSTSADSSKCPFARFSSASALCPHALPTDATSSAAAAPSAGASCPFSGAAASSTGATCPFRGAQTLLSTAATAVQSLVGSSTIITPAAVEINEDATVSTSAVAPSAASILHKSMSTLSPVPESTPSSPSVSSPLPSESHLQSTVSAGTEVAASAIIDSAPPAIASTTATSISPEDEFELVEKVDASD